MSDILGYKELTQEQICFINKSKYMEIIVLEHIRDYANKDPRWASIARTHFEEGFMALTKSACIGKTR